MERIPAPQEIYRHFKGNLYQVITVAEHSETGEKLVIYQALYGEYKTYARPLSMFTEKVDREKYPDAQQEYRFEAVIPGSGSGRTAEAADREAEATEAAAGRETEATEAAADRTAEKLTAETADRTEDAALQETGLDPMVLEFLDAGTYEERLNILAGLHHRITDDMINVMAMATDIEVKAGDVETRYAELRSCLLKLEKFECNRLR